MKKPEKKYEIPGFDCMCAAYGEHECGCGADWTDNNLRNKTIDECNAYHKEEMKRVLEGLKWTPRESWKDDVVRHNGQIDQAIQKLEEGK